MTDDDSILQKPDLEYKIILLGDTSVGKTCLFKRLTLDIYKEKNVSTIGIDKRTFKLKCDLPEKRRHNFYKTHRDNINGHSRSRTL